ncbi:MAG: 3-methyl-2-oxobutanoate hydroxymethyltransferase [Candidatus Gastranaerophilales bacterium]|nr:3-methyl-2-oxobutanoate hydroxymethyltransferase [Candidatus Gastranaerophilales bacterium]
MIKKTTIKTIQRLKENNEKITVLTAYDYSTAKYLDEAGIDIILVGDSLANVALGYHSTHSVSMNEMTIFVGAVSRGVSRALVVGDMPFMSYNVSVEDALNNAGRMIKAGANAIKIEGCNDYLTGVIKRCTQSGIPVLGHLGFTPQSVNILGSHSVQGKNIQSALEILEAAKKLQEAGVFAIVLEMISEESAKYITERLNIPTIGIGAGKYCSGHVMVSDDMLGKFSDYCPKFVRKYADIKSTILNAVKNYCKDVKEGNYPSNEEVFNLSEEENRKLAKEELLC